MNEQERQAMNASANYHSQLGSLAFEQGWEAAKRYFFNRPDDIEIMGAQIHQDLRATPIGG